MRIASCRRAASEVSGLALLAALALGMACANGSAPQVSRPEAAASASPEARERVAVATAFFSDPLLDEVTISPDGSHLAGIAEKDGAHVILVRPTRGGEVQTVAKVDAPHTRIRTLGWASDERLIAGVEMPHDMAAGVRARKTRLLAVNRDGTGIKYLGKRWPYQQWSSTQDNVLDWLPDDPDHILLNWWQPDQPGASVKKVAISSGALTPVVRHEPHVWQWVADHRGDVRAGWGYKGRSSVHLLYARVAPDEPFEKLIEYDIFREAGFYVAGFAVDPTEIYVFSDAATGFVALHEYDLTSKQLGPVIFEHPGYDLDHLEFDKNDGRLLCVDYDAVRPESHFVDEEARREQAAIDRALPGTVNHFADSDREDRLLLIYSYADTQPPAYYLYDRELHNVELLFHAYPDVDAEELAPMRPVVFQARDGLEIHGYLTVPKGAEPRDLPTIVYPHGGPTARDVWGYDATVQFLASRGFAVFQLNFRGSAGYGSRHRELGYREWGLSMQDDVTDGVRWLIAEGISDPERIGIYGGSYGGYAALMGLVKTPELFAAGASFAGVTDLPILLADDKWYRFDDFNSPTVGRAWGDANKLERNSPTHNADRIRAPVLLAHGTEDPRVHVRHATVMADTLEKAGKEVELYLYEGDVHGFINEANRIDFHVKLAAFFEKHLAPKGAASARAPESP